MKPKVVKLGKYYYKYDYENAIVRMMWKPGAKDLREMLADNAEWREKFGHDLWDLDEDNMTVINSAGLSREHWEDPEARSEYLSIWADDVAEEAAYEAESFVKYEMKR